MKNLSIIIFLTLISIASHSQETPRYVYCTITGFEKVLSRKVSIDIDFGQKTSLFKALTFKDDNGKAIVFNSTIDALNYMSKYKWEFVQAYTSFYQDDKTTHFLLKKSFNDLTEEEKKPYLQN